MPMILPEDDVTIENIATVLDDAAISYRIDEDGDLLVDEFSSTYWIIIDKERRFLRFYSFIPTLSSDEAALTQFANHCNNKVAMVQFGYFQPRQRLYGSYHLPYRQGILRPHLLLIARDFPGQFNHAVTCEDRDGLLDCEGPSKTADEDGRPHMLN